MAELPGVVALAPPPSPPLLVDGSAVGTDGVPTGAADVARTRVATGVLAEDVFPSMPSPSHLPTRENATGGYNGWVKKQGSGLVEDSRSKNQGTDENV